MSTVQFYSPSLECQPPLGVLSILPSLPALGLLDDYTVASAVFITISPGFFSALMPPEGKLALVSLSFFCSVGKTVVAEQPGGTSQEERENISPLYGVEKLTLRHAPVTPLRRPLKGPGEGEKSQGSLSSAGRVQSKFSPPQIPRLG